MRDLTHEPVAPYAHSMTRTARSLPLLVLALSWTASASDSETTTCSDHSIAASAVRTPDDVQAFVRCAAEYLMEHGTAEARRAFNEDERWNHGPMYVFVDGIAQSGEESIAYVFPPDPSREGTPWGTTVDNFGNDLFYELYRMMSIVDSGWIYNSFRNPETGRDEPKSSYVIKVDWDVQRAAVGAGIYAPDLPGTCNADEVKAAGLAAAPSEAKLQAFVRCAAMLVAEKGYFARSEFESGSRWRHGSSYVFVMDLAGNQLLTGNSVRVNGKALHEWGGKSRPLDQFGGRDMVAVGDAFGEAFIYYRGFNPVTGSSRPKVGLLKRVLAHGLPVIVGAGHDATDGQTWTNSTNWKTDAPLGEWHGMTTDAAGRETWLDLDANELTGSIPTDLGSLYSLEVLWLSENALTGPIPAALVSLPNLDFLYLSGNELTGSIPAALGQPG